MTGELDSSLSRRTIVKTGAKLAYAAPLVAASMHLHAASATSVSAPATGVSAYCRCLDGVVYPTCVERAACDLHGESLLFSACNAVCENRGGWQDAGCDGTTCVL